ncbi:KxYKxGKxW signal peptide domain-containing protein [Lacticaseibacillus kribbianus]|uniref:KxYKxGKxW signal peptide domain-containing protein n=1 Tax=Lacticaseibacillus kribbianus TaxID=2926292 RepID=UPI001CD73372|nr:hypothetical protein [Lacticaseibacillus kribbianus]
MSNRNGAKKLYKAHKTWIAAGLAAATLFSVQTFGAQTVSATGAGIQATEPVADTSALVASIAENKGFIAQLGIGNAKDTVTGKSFYGDFDALKAQVGKSINTMDDL